MSARSISRIDVPISSDISGFQAGIKKATKEGMAFAKEQSNALRKLPLAGAASEIALVGKAFADLGRSGNRSLLQVAANLAIVGRGAAGLAQSAIAAGKALATGGFNRIAELGKDAVEIGTTAEELSRLRNVARATGTDFQDLARFSSTLTDKINETIGRADLGADSFGRLGTSAEALAKLPVADQIRALNKGFNQLPNDAEKAKVAMALAGSVGIKNFRLLTLSVADFEKEYASGLVTTDEDVSEVRKLQIALDKIVDVVEKLANTFTTYLIPPLTRAADLLGGIAQKFGVAVAASKPIAMPSALAAGPSPSQVAAEQAKASALAKVQADLEARKQAAASAQAKVVGLQAQADKQAGDLRRNPGKLVQVPTTNGMGVKVRSTRQKGIDDHARTNVQLAEAKAEAKRLRDESLSVEESNAQALRMKQVTAEVGKLKYEYAESVRTAGQDDVHRRVAQVKGATPAQQKDLIAAGYRAREADRTSSLRDEAQESTKLPQQKLSEDLDRIGRLVKLGAANGGLSQAQGIRAAAMKTQESGLGGPTQLAGALDARSAEGRSYLLKQFQRTDDPTALARRGLELTGQTNNFLGKILEKIGSAGPVVRY